MVRECAAGHEMRRWRNRGGQLLTCDGTCAKPLDLRFPPEQLRSNPLRTRAIKTSEVLKLAQLRWTPHALQLERPGPPCDRCLGLHATASCPDYDGPQVRDIRKWLTVLALDEAAVQIARDVHAASRPISGDASGDSPMRCIIVNTHTSDGSGFHWFTVATGVLHPAPRSAMTHEHRLCGQGRV